MIRIFDFLLSAVGMLVLCPLIILVMILGWFDTGSPFFLQERVGHEQQSFLLAKFRTMRPDTASVASHLADASSITPFGRFLRRTKLDELPQLWNVLKGEMSLVGPRPCLFNQQELINKRNKLDVYHARPGITGLAQINGIDMSTPDLLAETDAMMLNNMSLAAYFRYIFLCTIYFIYLFSYILYDSFYC